MLGCQWLGGEVPVFFEPCHDFAIGRINEAMAETQLWIDANDLCRAGLKSTFLSAVLISFSKKT
jgi:hypothetical protein